MNRLTYDEAIENIAFTLKLASRGTPFVIECPEGNVLITPVANKAAEQVDDELREQEKAAAYHQGPLPIPGVNLPSQAEVAAFAAQETQRAISDLS
mgnify:CR=1 FL=1|tara:strand:+ start:1466 stop:1753 length:288 start_codon:yes stop_codon:yes gene_type:complete